MLYLIAILLPPVAIFLAGKPFQAIVNIPLTLLFWLPGMLHAILVVHNHYADQRTKRLVKAVNRQQRYRSMGKPEPYCGQCGEPLNRGAKFCRSCGVSTRRVRPVVESEPAPSTPSLLPSVGGTREWWGGRSGRTKIALAAGVVIVVISLIGGIAGEGKNETETFHPTTVVRLATATPAPTPLVAGANMPASKPVAPQQEQAGVYGTKLAPLLQQFSDDLDEIGTLAGSPQLYSTTWQRSWRSRWSDVKRLDAEIRKLNAPTCLASVHSTLMSATILYDRAADAAITGLDSFDSTKIAMGTALMQQANGLVGQVNRNIGAAC